MYWFPPLERRSILDMNILAEYFLFFIVIFYLFDGKESRDMIKLRKNDGDPQIFDFILLLYVLYAKCSYVFEKI